MNKHKIHIDLLEVENFKSIGPKIVFDFNKHSGLNYVYGINRDKEGVKNGSGKSSLMTDSILFALFGKTLKNTKNCYIPNRIVNPKKVVTDVNIYFTINSNKYRVRSYIQKHFDVVSCQLWVNDEEKTKGDARETRKFITNEILRCDYDLFKRSVILSASDSHNFFGLNKGKKREYIEGVFHLTVFGEMLKAIRIDGNSLDKEILSLQSEVKHIRETLNDYKLKNDSFEKDKDSVVNDLSNKIEFKTERIKDLKVELDESEKKDLKTASNLDNLKFQFSQIVEAAFKSKNILKNCITNINTSTKEINKHKDVYDIICSDCKGLYEDAFNIKEFVQQIKNNKDKCKEYNIILSKIGGSKEILNDKINNITEINKKIQKINEEVTHNKWVKDHLQNDITGLISRVEDEKKKEPPFIDLIEKSNNNLNDRDSILKDYYKKKSHLDILEYIVSEDGAKKYIIKDLIDVLNSLIRKYLDETGADFTVVFDSNFDVTFLTSSGECEFSSFSAGESGRLNWAVTLAFKDILGSNIESNICVMDEMLDKDGIDAYAIKALIAILRRISSSRKQTIFIISHRDAAEDEHYDNTIRVEKNNGITTIAEDTQGEMK